MMADGLVPGRGSDELGAVKAIGDAATAVLMSAWLKLGGALVPVGEPVGEPLGEGEGEGVADGLGVGVGAPLPVQVIVAGGVLLPL
jgi:hypothetical protein